MDIHHPYAVHNVSKHCTTGTIKKTLKYFLCFEWFFFVQVGRGKRYFAVYCMNFMSYCLSLAESWRYGAEQLEKNKFQQVELFQ